MPNTNKPNAIESADWEIRGNRRLSDEAIHALALLATDLGEAAEQDGLGEVDDQDGE